VFVSLTTLPSRIGRLRPTVDSLQAQTLPPDWIYVCVPDRSLREDREYALPDWLRSPPPGVEVVQCGTDHGPGTKLLGCLPRIAGEACLITVDDDLVYRPFLVERLYRAQLDRPAASFSFFVYDVGRFRCGQSADGFSFWTPNLARVEAFAARALRSPHLFVQDDLWISLYLQNEGIAIASLQHTLPPGQFVWERQTHRDGQLGQLDGSLRRSIVMREGTRFLVRTRTLGARLRRLYWLGRWDHLRARVERRLRAAASRVGLLRHARRRAR